MADAARCGVGDVALEGRSRSLPASLAAALEPFAPPGEQRDPRPPLPEPDADAPSEPARRSNHHCSSLTRCGATPPTFDSLRRHGKPVDQRPRKPRSMMCDRGDRRRARALSHTERVDQGEQDRRRRCRGRRSPGGRGSEPCGADPSRARTRSRPAASRPAAQRRPTPGSSPSRWPAPGCTPAASAATPCGRSRRRRRCRGSQ